ncbi:MAG: hydrogenase maturation protease, partial [Gemmatimonadetes bacterium]|nr:hydrogenase maturation protease [Gemmatimonadota bacterium]
AEHVAGLLPAGGRPDGRRLTVLLAVDVPESWLGPAAAARPDTVLLVDAADLGAAPGSAALLEPEDLAGGAAFTHRTPLSLLSTFLRRETGADVLLLAVQPRSLEWGEAMSPEVESSARHLGDILASALHREATAC